MVKDKPAKPRKSREKPTKYELYPQPIPNLGSLDGDSQPPLRGKVHPPQEMDKAVPTSDDEMRHPHYHPSDAAGVEFDSDPIAADAAADLASDFGVEFLDAATRGQDVSDVILEHADAQDTEDLMVVEEDTDQVEMHESGEPREGRDARARRAVPGRSRI